MAGRNIPLDHYIAITTAENRPFRIRLAMVDDSGIIIANNWGILNQKKFASDGSLLSATSTVLDSSDVDVVFTDVSHIVTLNARSVGNGLNGLGYFIIDCEVYGAS